MNHGEEGGVLEKASGNVKVSPLVVGSNDSKDLHCLEGLQ